MKRLHVHVNVTDLDRSIHFYSRLFAAEPTVRKADYAKWMLDDPRVNFAISQVVAKAGVDHLGLQVEDAAELELVGQRLQAAGAHVVDEKNVTCCYARADKYWTEDPQGVLWESFLTHEQISMNRPVDTAATGIACCATDSERKGACCS